LAECERDPLVPDATIAAFPVEALASAEKRTDVLDPAATLKGLDGLETTPAGKPARVTWTVPLKPLVGLTERLTAGLVAPCWTLMEFEAKPMEKSGCGGGGGGGLECRQIRLHNHWRPAARGRVTNLECVVSAVPSKDPTFVARPEKPSQRENSNESRDARS
jgi:hypothetical protein